MANTSEAHIGGTLTFEVFTMNGQKVWEKSHPLTTTYATERWNLTSTAGVPLPKGIYIFRATISSPAGSEEMNGERLVIVGN